MAFTYKKATDSDLTKAYREREKQLQETKPSAFVSKEYVPGATAAMSEEYLNKYLNRGPFKYDMNGDALLAQYRENAKRQGKMAMDDTMGKTASMTGGFGNSWAQTAGQQAYNNSLAEVNNVIPELWQMAYDMYEQEGDNLLAKHGVLADKEATEYGRHLDEENLRRQAWEDQQNDWLTQMGWARDDLNTSIDRDRADASEENSYAYQQDRDAVEDSRWQQEFDLSKEASKYTASEEIKGLSASQEERFEAKLEEGKEAAWGYIDLLEAQHVSESVLEVLADQIEARYPDDDGEVVLTDVPSLEDAYRRKSRWGNGNEYIAKN